jgi:murein L,D-transpeptidase YafK
MRTFLVSLIALLVSACVAVSTSEGLQYKRNDPQRGQVKSVLPRAPVLLRIIKEDSVLEVWQQEGNRWYKSNSYPICKFSGDIGPKKREGDRQAPEGFYTITRQSLNPFSREYLSIDTGFPNQYDRAHRYTGSALMIHGACSSIGCYAITDKYMEEVYAVVRTALEDGQDSIQLQIYPFRMSSLRMLSMDTHKDYQFWKQLKIGWDWFETYQQPIPVTVVNGSYRIGS